MVTKAPYVADQSDPAKNQYVFSYTIKITNTGDVAAQLVSPPLVHHRRRSSRAGSEGRRRRRTAACAEARRELRVHQRREHRDAGRDDEGQLPDGQRGRHARSRRRFRRSRFRAAHAALKAASALVVRRAAFARPACGARRTSRRRGPRRSTAPAPPRDRSSPSCARFALSLSIAAAMLVTACQVTPPAPRRHPRTAAPPIAGAPARAVFTPVTFAERARLGRRRHRRDVAGAAGGLPRACSRTRSRRRSGSEPAPRRRRSTAATGAPCVNTSRAILVRTGSPPPTAATPGSSPATTSRCSRVRACRTAAYTVPLYAVPDDLLDVDLVELFPELKDKRVRGRVEGKRVVPYWPRADIERGKAPLAGKALAYVARADRRVLPADPGLRADQAGRRHGDARRLRRPERPPVPLDRARADRARRVDARPRVEAVDRGVGPRAIPTSSPRCSTRTRATCSFAKWRRRRRDRSTRRSTGRIGALGVPLLARRTIAVDPRLIPLGAPVFLATTMPLSGAAARIA